MGIISIRSYHHYCCIVWEETPRQDGLEDLGPPLRLSGICISKIHQIPQPQREEKVRVLRTTTTTTTTTMRLRSDCDSLSRTTTATTATMPRTPRMPRTSQSPPFYESCPSASTTTTTTTMCSTTMRSTTTTTMPMWQINAGVMDYAAAKQSVPQMWSPCAKSLLSPIFCIIFMIEKSKI